MKKDYYNNRTEKLLESLKKYLSGIRDDLMLEYGEERANAESLGFSLRQTSTIDSGTCTFCFNKKGTVHWPENIREII